MSGVNGFSTEEDNRRGHDQICCLVDDSQRCSRPAGNASYNKRIQKTVQQRRLKLTLDHSVRKKMISDIRKVGVIAKPILTNTFIMHRHYAYMLSTPTPSSLQDKRQENS